VHSRVKGVYARHRENAVDYAKRHGIPTVFDTTEALFADGEITAVYISTPPNAHKDYALACIAAGKIPYIEKPMAMNYGECEEILRAAEKAKIPVYVAYYRRGLEKYLKIKEILDGGAIGKIRFVRCNQFMRPEVSDLDSAHLPWRLVPEISSGGKFVDMMVHVIDLVQFFFGDIVDVHGFAANNGGFYDVEDTVCASFRSQSGVLISGAWCYVSDYDDEELLIVGEKGHIRTTGLAYKPVQVTINGREETLEFAEPEHIAQPYEQLVINEILGLGTSTANVKSAANNVRVVDEILGEYRLTHYRRKEEA
jgi:predicted dehydrogenase